MLERHRIRCWIAPRDVTPGDEWAAGIIKGLNASRIMVLIFSDHANASKQVRKEVERAISKDLPVLAFRIQNVAPKDAMEFNLCNIHWLDAFTPPVEAQLELLAGSVKKLLGRDPEQERPGTGAGPDDLPPRPRAFWPIAIAASLLGLLVLGVMFVMIIVPRNSAHNTTATDNARKQIVQAAEVTGNGQSQKSPEGVTPTRRLILRDPSPNPIPAVQVRIPPAGPARLASKLTGLGGSSVTVVGDQLFIEGTGAALVRFGDETWGDYDLTFEINKSPRPVEMKKKTGPRGGPLGIGARFRDGSLKTYAIFLGGADDRNQLIRSAKDTHRYSELLPPASGMLRLSVWQTVKISLRGPRIRVELDGQEIFNATDDYCRKGSVSLLV